MKRNHSKSFLTYWFKRNIRSTHEQFNDKWTVIAKKKKKKKATFKEIIILTDCCLEKSIYS